MKLSALRRRRLEDFPSIEDTGAVIRQVNRLFDPYVFFERHRDSIELWCSCCLRHGEIDILPRTNDDGRI